MTKTKKVIVEPFDQPDLDATPSTEEKAPVVDQYTADAVAFWQEYLSTPRRKRHPAKLTKLS